MSLFSERLASRRKARNLTQEELAAQSGLSESTITAWERGINPPTARMLQKLEAPLGVSSAWLLGGSHEDEAQALHDATFEVAPVLAALTTPTLRVVMADLSRVDYDPEKDAAMLSLLSAVVGELRRRAAPISSKAEAAAAAAGKLAASSARSSPPGPKR